MNTQSRYKQIRYNPMTSLQALVPRNTLDYGEALTIAEIQATALLKMLRVERPPVPVERLAKHLGVEVRHDHEADELGYHRIQDDVWYIYYGDGPMTSQNATIAHHLKRIIDTPFGESLYPPVDVMSTVLRQHYVAEYFAMCLTLPTRWVERAWRRDGQDIEALAEAFGVSREAMLFRLKVLRLIGPAGE